MKSLKLAGGVAGEEDAVLAVADGALDLAELGGGEPFAAEIDEEEKDAAGDVEAALGGGGAHVVAEHELEIGEAVVAAHEDVIAEKQEAGGVGERLGEDGKIDAADAGAKGEEAEDERERAPAAERPSSRANGKLANGFQKAGSLVQPRKTRKSGDRL